jgi:hypothetical protein
MVKHLPPNDEEDLLASLERLIVRSRVESVQEKGELNKVAEVSSEDFSNTYDTTEPKSKVNNQEFILLNPKPKRYSHPTSYIPVGPTIDNPRVLSSTNLIGAPPPNTPSSDKIKHPNKELELKQNAIIDNHDKIYYVFRIFILLFSGLIILAVALLFSGYLNEMP